MRHREAWAEEKKAPNKDAWERELAEEQEKQAQEEMRTATSAEAGDRQRRTISPTKNEAGEELPRDVLVVVSKLKKYVKARSGMRTSDTVMPLLSDELRRICDRAIRIANESGRTTILDRDIKDALR
jgi:histone H3/H4